MEEPNGLKQIDAELVQVPIRCVHCKMGHETASSGESYFIYFVDGCVEGDQRTHDDQVCCDFPGPNTLIVMGENYAV